MTFHCEFECFVLIENERFFALYIFLIENKTTIVYSQLVACKVSQLSYGESSVRIMGQSIALSVCCSGHSDVRLVNYSSQAAFKMRQQTSNQQPAI
jgi:hypothetical protein